MRAVKTGRAQTHALTYPADTRESDPSTTPPLNSIAMMVVYKQKEKRSVFIPVIHSTIAISACNRRPGVSKTLQNLFKTLNISYLLRSSPPPTTTLTPFLPTWWCRDSAATTTVPVRQWSEGDTRPKPKRSVPFLHCFLVVSTVLKLSSFYQINSTIIQQTDSMFSGIKSKLKVKLSLPRKELWNSLSLYFKHLTLEAY